MLLPPRILYNSHKSLAVFRTFSYYCCNNNIIIIDLAWQELDVS